MRAFVPFLGLLLLAGLIFAREDLKFPNTGNLMEALERDKRQIGCIFGDLSCKARCGNSKACCVKRYCHCTGC